MGGRVRTEAEKEAHRIRERERYYKNRSTVEGLAAEREKRRAYYHKNKERIKQRGKAYLARPEIRALRAARDAYYKKTPAGIASYKRARRKYDGLPLPTRPEPHACELCNKQSRIPLHLDHDHKTGRFRGWLCFNCNTSIGKLGDTVEGLKRAIAYLERADE